MKYNSYKFEDIRKYLIDYCITKSLCDPYIMFEISKRQLEQLFDQKNLTDIINKRVWIDFSYTINNSAQAAIDYVGPAKIIAAEIDYSNWIKVKIVLPKGSHVIKDGHSGSAKFINEIKIVD